MTFTPASAGAQSAAVLITDNAPGSPHQVSLDGTGFVPAPAVSLSPAGLSFGNQRLHGRERQISQTRDAGCLIFGGGGTDLRIQAAGGGGHEVDRNRPDIARIGILKELDLGRNPLGQGRIQRSEIGTARSEGIVGLGCGGGWT